MAYLEFASPDFRTWLERFNFSEVSHTNNTGRIGMWERDTTIGYTDETILKFDISQLLFSTITEASLEWVSSSKGGQSSGDSQTARLFKQDKTDFLSWSSTPVFDDFAQSPWASQLATIASVWNTGTYEFIDNTTFRQYIQDWVNWGKDDNGVIVAIEFGATTYWLSLNSTKLKITYTPPDNTPWGMKYVIDQNVGLQDCRMMGGVSPNVDDMVVKSISIALGDSKSENPRLAVYTGGDLNDPVGASLLWDAGQVSGFGANKWYTITHPSGGVDWPKNTNTWLAFKANGNTTDVLFSGQSVRSGNMQSARGRFASTGMSADETASYEATIPSGGAFSNFWYPIVIQYAIEENNGSADSKGLNRGIYKGVNRGIV